MCLCVAGEVQVHVNRVLVATSTKYRQTYVLAADFPEAPTKNEVTILLIDPSSNREIDRAGSIFWVGNSTLDEDIELHLASRRRVSRVPEARSCPTPVCDSSDQLPCWQRHAEKSLFLVPAAGAATTNARTHTRTHACHACTHARVNLL